MLQHNRNLSSIVGTIQDEGPPAGAPGQSTARDGANSTAGSAAANTLSATRAGGRRSAWRGFFYLLLATLVLAAAFIFLMGGRGGYLADLPYGPGQYLPEPYTRAETGISGLAENAAPADKAEPAETAGVAVQDSSFSNQEIQERQVQIMKHLEELTAAIADIRAGNDQSRIDNRAELKRMQEEFQHKIDEVVAVVAGLQEAPAARKESSVPIVKGSSDMKVAPPDAGGVPARGGWVVNVANSENTGAIEKLMNKLHKRGIPAEIQEVTIGGKLRYRLRIPGFSTGDEARDYARNLDSDLGVKGPWVSKR